MGSKGRLAKWLASAITPIRNGRTFWDPFCGGLSCAVELSKAGPGLVSDAHPALIALYRAVWDGWDPPSNITEEQYRAAKELPDEDPMKAFAGFGCSFGGKWFGGYGRSHSGGRPNNLAQITRNVLLRDVTALKDARCTLACMDFLSVEPYDIGTILYLDPPYKGTTKYSGNFDYEKFRVRVAQWACYTDVFVSEYEMPGTPIMEFTHELGVAGGRQADARVERLYHYHPNTPIKIFGRKS